MRKPRVLITGATGYIGGRLVRELESGAYRLRALARRPEYLISRVAPDTEVVAGNVLDRESLRPALLGVDTAYYLIHSMGVSRDFETADRDGARNFGEVAASCGVKRIIYLGGLGEGRESLSKHLRSRHEVGEILRESGVEVIEFRASIVLGSGSLSFELIRALTERLPVMITPRWVSVPAQPIAIGDLLGYLVSALELRHDGNRTFEIGGRDVITYGGLMREYARQRGLRRVLISVPVLTPRLSSLWLAMVTPVYNTIGRKLIESLRHPTVVTDHRAREVFGVRPIAVSEAISLAMRNEDERFAATRWSDALSSAGSVRGWGGSRFGNRLVDSRTVRADAGAADVFRVIQRLGGRNGWLYADWLWKLRGALDLLAGGVGMRRGRRDPDTVRVGDVVDCWRVEKIVQGRLLRLVAELKLPGRAWLEFEIEGDGAPVTIRQTATFDPIGLFGLLYWYGLYPIHQLVFHGLLKRISESVRRRDRPR